MFGKRGWLGVLIILVVSVLTLVACQSDQKPPAPSATIQAAPPVAVPTAAAPAVPVPAAAAPTAAAALAAPTAAAAPAAPSARKPAGTLTALVNGLGSEQWLPNQASNIQLGYVTGIYDFLLRRDPETRNLIPSLAESWDVSADGLAWAFKLRKGVQFQENWGEVTSADVKFSLEVVLRTGSVSTRAGAIRSAISAVETPDPYTVIFRTKTPVVWLAYDFSNQSPNVPVLSKRYVEEKGETTASLHPVGSGPYRFVEQKAGDYFKMEALDTHWRVVPYFKTVIVKAVPEQSTRLAMVRTGEADISDIPIAFKQEAVNAGLDIRRVPNASFVWAQLGNILLPDKPTYDPKVPWVGPDPQKALKVRQALNMAVNKPDIVNYVLMGEATELVVPMYIPNTPYVLPTWKPLPNDLTKAKQLLVEAGYPNGFELTMRIVSNPGVPETPMIAEAVAMAWEKIGVKVKRVNMDYNTMRTDFINRKLANTTWMATMAATDEPYQAMAAQSHSKNTTLLLVEDPEIDKLTDLAGTTIDPQKRLAIQQQLGQFVHDQSFAVPVAVKNALYVVSKQVDKLPITASRPYLHNLEYVTGK